MGGAGREAESGIPPHWKHGEKMPDEVIAEHKRKWNRLIAP